MYHIVFIHSFFDEHLGCMLTIKLLEENIGSMLFDMGLSNIFLYISLSQGK